MRGRASGFPAPPHRGARLAAFARGAGLDAAHVLQAGVAAQREFAARVAARDREPWPTLRSRGIGEAVRSDMDWTRVNLVSG
jgi:hypothetical protein